jgi:hypothetical protein
MAIARERPVNTFPRQQFKNLGCLHPVACIRSGSGVSVKRNSVSLVVYYLFKLSATCFGRTTRWKYIPVMLISDVYISA